MKKRVLSIVLAICMVFTFASAPAIAEVSAEASDEVSAETENISVQSTALNSASSTNSVPSVTAFATPEQLMTEFLPDKEGNAVTIGKLLFGKNSVGEPQEWYILGKDTGVSGDNLTLFAANHMATGQMFSESLDHKTFTYNQNTGYGSTSGSVEVYPNHYGASDLNAKLNEMAESEQCFSVGERSLMNSVRITTNDAKNSNNYTLNSKLYAVAGDLNNDQKLWLGTDNGTYIDVNDYYSDCACNNCENVFWIRNPYIDENINFFSLVSDSTGIGFCQVDTGLDILPAANLNLSHVLFASVVGTSASGTATSGTIASGTAMQLRIDGSSKDIGTVNYDLGRKTIEINRGNTENIVSLVVQGNDGTNDWYYSKPITESEILSLADIEVESHTPQSVDLTACKIWLEMTDSTDGLIYAVPAKEGVNSNYATKQQLQQAFTPSEDGTADNIGKLIFGKNSGGGEQDWYILGTDTGVAGDNTVLVAASPIIDSYMFDADFENEKMYSKVWECSYQSSETISAVYQNHYGGSCLRDQLRLVVANTNYFTAAEQNLMNETTVKTIDTSLKDKSDNFLIYTTTDKLYALAAELYGRTIQAGSDNQITISLGHYWGGKSVSWLRTPSYDNPYNNISQYALAQSHNGVLAIPVTWNYPVLPAANLNLTSVLFASSVKVNANAVSFGTLSADSPLRLRFDGSAQNLGSVIYSTESGNIKVARGKNTGTVTLVVQNHYGESNWYYSKQITADETVRAADIKTALGFSEDIELSNCNIWLETTKSDGLIYAVQAEKEIEKINTAFVTKDRLMDSFTPYTDGTTANTAKITFGKNSNGEAQEWYVLGKDNGVAGDNIILFAANPITTNQVFSADTGNKTYNYPSGTGYGNKSGSIEVYANHYGASALRTALNSICRDSRYFSATQQGMMNSTAVTAEDTKNSVVYTTTDKLYVPTALGFGIAYQAMKVGSGDNTAISMSSFWNSGDWIPLRAPCAEYSTYTLVAVPGLSVAEGNDVTNKNVVQPASNLNISNVLFASSAKASKSGVLAGDIAADTPLALRLDGTDKAIGTVYYDATNGKISAQKDANATEAVSLVIQGNDGTKDWSYSVRISDKKTVTAEQIKYVCGIDDFSLVNCNIWLETTIDNVSYAKTAVAKTITEEPEKNIVIIEADMHAEGLVVGANTVADCKAELESAEMYIEIKNINGDVLTNIDLVGTGATITYYNRTTNAVVKVITVVLYGDVNGDGLCDSTDYDMLINVASLKATLDNQWFIMAADITRDGAYDAYDAMALDLFLNGYIEIEQKNV